MPRSHETKIVIDAPLEEVWAALTDAQRMMSWFAPKVTVVPGAGGRIVSHWGRGMDWPTTIEIWEPLRHLRLTETRDRMISPVMRKMSTCTLVQDCYLEADNGKTVLRFVHSGFGDDEDWDLEYDSTRAGWFGWFFRLRHALERHQGEPALNGLEILLLRGTIWQEVASRFESLTEPPKEIAYRKPNHLGALLPAHGNSIITLRAQPYEAGTLLFLEYLFFSQAPELAGSVVASILAKMRGSPDAC